MKPLDFHSTQTPLNPFGYGTAASGVIIGLLAHRIQHALQYYGSVSLIENTTASSVLSAGGSSAPIVDSGFISRALQGAKGVAFAAWNFIPSSTKLLGAAALCYWAWRKWHGSGANGVQIQNSTTSKVEIHIHANGSGSTPSITEKTRKEKDGRMTTVVDMTFSEKEDPKKSIIVVPSELFRKLLFSTAI